MSAVKLPQAARAYDKDNESATRKAVETADAENFKRGQDMRLQRGERLIKKASTGGNLFEIGVDATGRLFTVSTT
jgi:hypothetical protein